MASDSLHPGCTPKNWALHHLHPHTTSKSTPDVMPKEEFIFPLTRCSQSVSCKIFHYVLSKMLPDMSPFQFHIRVCAVFLCVNNKQVSRSCLAKGWNYCLFDVTYPRLCVSRSVVWHLRLVQTEDRISFSSGQVNRTTGTLLLLPPSLHLPGYPSCHPQWSNPSLLEIREIFFFFFFKPLWLKLNRLTLVLEALLNRSNIWDPGSSGSLQTGSSQQKLQELWGYEEWQMLSC